MWRELHILKLRIWPSVSVRDRGVVSTVPRGSSSLSDKRLLFLSFTLKCRKLITKPARVSSGIPQQAPGQAPQSLLLSAGHKRPFWPKFSNKYRFFCAPNIKFVAYKCV